MQRTTVPIKSVFSHFIWISAIVLLMPFGSILGDCLQNYPDSDVTKQLNKTEYLNCELDVMVQDYANFLQDKHRLLSALKPVYVRKLEKDFEEQEGQIRLTEYDTELNALLKNKESLVSMDSAIKKDKGTDGSEEVSQETKNRLRQQLNESLGHIKVLKRKIKQAKEEIKTEEYSEFCKLDFYFRVSEKLYGKIEECLNHTN